MKRHAPSLLLVAALASAPAVAGAQAGPGPSWSTDAAVREIAQLLEDRYAREDVARRYAQGLRERLASGAYARLHDGDALAARLTADLQAIHPDRHLRVRFSADPLPPDEPDAPPTAAGLEQMRREQLRDNVGFEKVEVLPGNVGYLSFRYFGDPPLGAPRLDAAMAFLGDTDALIIDLRRNMGATDPGLMDLLNRYLVRDADLVTASVEWRGADPELTRPRPAVEPGSRRYLDKPVILLTSGGTFSGAEGFAYNLQALRRVQVVGQRTGGGANPGRELRAGPHFAVWVPMGIVTHPLTGTNWEGTGVVPDIEVRQQRALERGVIAALDRLLADPGLDAAWRAQLQERRQLAEEALARPEPGMDVAFRLPGHREARDVFVVGSFNGWAPGSDRMERHGGGWRARVRIEPGRHEYKFWVDGQWIPDPANPPRGQDDPGQGNSRLHVRMR